MPQQEPETKEEDAKGEEEVGMNRAFLGN